MKKSLLIKLISK